MLSSITRFSVRNKLIIILFTIGLILAGIISFRNLPIDAVPDVTNNQVLVITQSPSLAAPEIERLITFPIEQTASTIPGIKEIRSFSRFGLSLVTLVFKDDIDVYWARQQVAERLQQVKSQIPADAGNPEMAPVTTGLGEIFQYAVVAEKGYEGKYDAQELRTIQDWIIRRQLLGTPGIADVSSFGGFLKQYEIAINPSKLKSVGITIDDVFTALEKNNQNTGGSYIEKGQTVLYIRSEGLASDITEIASIPVRHTSSGMPIFIKDIAEVKIGHANRYGAMVYNDKGEVAGAVVMMLKGENSSKVINAVKQKIEKIQKSLPEGVRIEPFLDRTKMVNNAIGTVRTNLIEGALIVIFILVIFLGNLRAGLIVASVIPLSMLFAVIMMDVFGVSGNLMSLGALDFGLIVDGAVIIVEAVLHKLYHGKAFSATTKHTTETMNETVSDTAGKMMGSAVFGQIIILIVYLPILTLVGIEGKMFKPMAQTVSFALIGAFVLSLTYVPMAASLFLSKKTNHKENWSDKAMNWIQHRYRKVLSFALKIPTMIVGVTLIFFAISVFLLTTLGGEFIPELEEGDFAVDTRVITGSSLSTTIDATQRTSKVLLKNFPEIEKIVSKIGSGEIPTDPMPVEAADMMVILKDKKEWTSAKSFDELANKMGAVLQEVPGVSTGFQFPVQMRFNELMTGARQDVVCKIFGEDLDTLVAYAKKLGDIITTVEGAKDLYVETVTGLPQIVIEYDRAALAVFRLNISDVNRVVRTAFGGEVAGMIYENERRFELVVRLNEDQRKDISNVENLLIPTPGGTQIPLSQVAKVQIKEGPNQIQREDAKRRIVVGFNVRGRDVQSIVTELNQKVEKQISFPAAYYVTYGGEFENLVEAKKRLSIAVPVALVLILVMLYFAFGSVKHGLLIFSAIPLSAIGGVFALWIRDMPFSISAGVGFIALFGVAVLNGIVLITEFNRLKSMGELSIKQVILEGTRIRLRPVLMTAAVASLGFLPMAISNGAGAGVQRPLATVVIGGLITATLLTLVVLPILYLWFEKLQPKTMKTPINTAVITIFLLITSVGFSNAQGQGRKLSLNQMIDTAHQKNLGLLIADQQKNYWHKLQESVYETGKSVVSAEFGQVNSFNSDTRFSIAQPIFLPVIYKRQSQVYNKQEKAVQSFAAWKRSEVDREISNCFYSMVDLMERDKLLISLDSLYRRFSEAASSRLKAGETNILESTAAETQLQQIVLQRQQLIADVKVEQLKLQYLMQSKEELLPDYQSPKKSLTQLPDSVSVLTHPYLLYQQEQVALASAITNLEKNRLLPEFLIGYFNQSIKGWQSADATNQKYYSVSDRFSSVQGSVSIPLFNKTTKARINAGKINESIASMNAKQVEASLSSEAAQALQQVKKFSQSISYYENTASRQATTIEQNAQKSFSLGESNYLEWSMLMNQVIGIRLGYLDAIRNFNHALIQLEYLLSK